MATTSNSQSLRSRCIAMVGLAVLVVIDLYAQQQPDYTTKVPRYEFADTLEEQEAQL